MKKRGAGTTAVHGAHQTHAGPLGLPIEQTSTFAFASTAEMRRYLLVARAASLGGVEDEADLAADLEQALAG